MSSSPTPDFVSHLSERRVRASSAARESFGAERVRIGMVGVGRWGSCILRTLQRLTEVEVVAVCDPRPEVAQLAQGAAVHSCLDSMLNGHQLDAVVVASPPELHADHACRALQRGLDVFVEKPMATSSAEALAMMTAARRARRLLAVGHIIHYQPAFEEALQVLRSGELGEPLLVSAERLRSHSDATSAWWSMSPHDISAVLRICGGFPSTLKLEFRAVQARAELRFEQATAIVVGGGGGRRLRRLLVVGTSKMLLLDETLLQGGAYAQALGVCRVTSSLLRAVKTRAVADWSGDELLAFSTLELRVPDCKKEPLLTELEAFVSSVRTGLPLYNDALDGLAVTTVLEAGQRSGDSGGALQRLMLPQPRVRRSGAEALALEVG